MNRFVISALATAAIAGSVFSLRAIAATDSPDSPGMHRMAEAGFLLDAKLAGMQAALKLTPDQEKLWPAFEAAVRDGHKARMEAMRTERGEGEARPSPIARMTEMSEHLAKASEALKKVADAAKPLYDSLDDGQKRHFGPLLRMLRGGGTHREMHEGAMPEGPGAQ